MMPLSVKSDLKFGMSNMKSYLMQKNSTNSNMAVARYSYFCSRVRYPQNKCPGYNAEAQVKNLWRA